MNRSHNASNVSIGPGAHHPYNPYGIPPYGAQHAPYLEPGLSDHHAGPAAHSNDQIMRMLKQILNQQQGGTGEGSSKDVDGESEIREDDNDTALARKEGFGESKDKKNELREKTRRAERRGSLSSNSSGSGYEDEDAQFPNPWARFRHALREPFAEFLGTSKLRFYA